MAKFIEEFHIPLARDSYEESDITDDRKCIYLSRAVGLQPKGKAEIGTNQVEKRKLKKSSRENSHPC